MSDMESPATMGEAGENDCKEKARNAEDGACVNGNLSMDDSMECEDDDSKAHVISVKDINSLKNNDKVPENKVPILSGESEPMEVDGAELTDDTSKDGSNVAVDRDCSNVVVDRDCSSFCFSDSISITKVESVKSLTNGSGMVNLVDTIDLNRDRVRCDARDRSEPGATVELGDDDEDGDEEEEEEEDDDDLLFMDMVDAAGKDSSKRRKDSECVELNDSGDVVVIDNDSERKENGELCSSPEVEEVSFSAKDSGGADVVNLVTPAKKKLKKPQDAGCPPRRSSRNLNKQKSYIEKEDDPDIEEVTPVDPLALGDPLRDDKENSSKKPRLTTSPSSTIVVSDTKRLVEIAANSKASNSSGKKEPTLVIIDTNSILSGRGPVPVSHKPSSMSTSFSMMPVALPAQGVYPPNMRATITPIPMTSAPAKPAATPAPPAPILPSLTDDMYVVEAPSFIVPYVYEKPPLKPLKLFVENVAKELEEERRLNKERREQRALRRGRSDDEDDEEDEDDGGDHDSDHDGGDDKKPKSGTADTEDERQKDPKAVKDAKDAKDAKEVKEVKGAGDKSAKKSDASEDSASDRARGGSVSEADSAEPSVSVVRESEPKTIDLDEIPDDKADASKPKSSSYFDNALGVFFINIGYGLVQEFVQTDLLKQQKRKQNREGAAPDTRQAISSLLKNLEYTKENNEPYKMEQKKCEFCSFKTESGLVMAHHLETPHMRNYVYKCNFCPLEVRSPHDILFHMEAEHNIRGRLERAPAFHQCPNCPFEDNQKGKLSRHLFTCGKKFKPERNLEPPHDWEPPAKIPRVPRIKQGLAQTAATYQAFAAQAKGNYQLLSKLQQATVPQAFPRGRGRPSLMGKMNPVRTQPPIIRANMMYRPSTSGGSVLVPTTYQFGGSPIYQVVGGQTDRLSGSCSPSPVALVPNLSSATSTVTIQNSSGPKSNSNKVVQQPSISITPLPRQPASASSSSSSATITKTSGESSKATFVICEICDGYIKDLEQLRNHMQWIHKVKIHPKMIYNRPPLNCQKCQFRFFTDQGLERHLLGSHGLVTSSMQEAANKSKDSGRCPVCGRVYQWKLLNHVARDHNMTLKPAHLSYKCTVCTATFGMYKQFENHVYSAHSVVAKRVMEKKNTSVTPARTNDSLLKPLKINDEITIIPQPAKAKTNSAMRSSTAATADRGK